MAGYGVLWYLCNWIGRVICGIATLSYLNLFSYLTDLIPIGHQQMGWFNQPNTRHGAGDKQNINITVTSTSLLVLLPLYTGKQLKYNQYLSQW